MPVNGRRRPRQHGWLLASLIVLVSAVILALVGVTLFLTEHLRLTSLRQNQTKAVYLAQAGVMQAIYDVRFDGPGGAEGNGFTLGESVVTAGPPDDVFILGGKAADFLLVNMIPAVLDQGNLSGQRDRLRLWRIRNVLQSSTAPGGMDVQCTHMTVTWHLPPAPPPAGEGVVRIEINGNRVWPLSGTLSPPVASGTEIDIVDVTVPSATERTGNTIWFSTNNVMPGKAFVDVSFRMSDHVVSSNPLDASIRIARYTAAVSTRSASFTVKSVGEARRSAFPLTVWRRLQAEYRLNEADSTNLQAPGTITIDPARPLVRPGYHELDRRTP